MMRLSGILYAAVCVITVEASSSASPVNRVVALLNDLKLEVTKEGETEIKLYDKFMCWCKKSIDEKDESIRIQQDRIHALAPSLDENNQQFGRVEQEVESLKEELEEHRQAQETARTVREKEEAKYNEDTATMKQTIDGLKSAIAVLEKARDSSNLLQVSSAVKAALIPVAGVPRVHTALMDKSMQSLLRTELLQAPFESDHIVGVLQGLLYGFEDDLKETEKTEAEAVKNYESLSSSKTKEIDASQAVYLKLINEKSALSTQLARDRADLEATQSGFALDSQQLQAMRTECSTKTAELHQRQEKRLEELMAINQATQILNQDDVTVHFSKTITASIVPVFLQVRRAPLDVVDRLRALARSNPRNTKLAMLATKLQEMSGQNFQRVIEVIEKDVEMLTMEQTRDDEKKKWCVEEEAKNVNEQTAMEQEQSNLKLELETLDAELKALKEEATQITKDIDDLNSEVANAEGVRKEENVAYTGNLIELHQAQQALFKAIQVLEGFYGQQALTQQSARVTSSGDGDGSEALEGAPDTPDGEYHGKTFGGKAVLKMLGQIGEDLIAEEAESKKEEKEASDAYDLLKEQSKTNLMQKHSQLMTRKEQIARADQLQATKEEDVEKSLELSTLLKERQLDLVRSCGAIVDQYERRKGQRDADKDAMQKAIAILS